MCQILLQSISPGLVETEFHVHAFQDANEASILYSSNPCLQPKDIAAAALHILSSPSHVEVSSKELLNRLMTVNCWVYQAGSLENCL